MASTVRIGIALLGAGVLLLAGCASSGGAGGRPGCAGAIDSAYLAGGPVYRECDVDQAAKLVTPPPRPPVPTTHWDVREGCARAEVEFVVDERGVPVAEPVRIVSSNSSAMAQALRRAVQDMRFQPAIRGGEPVRQLVRYGMATVVMVRSSPVAGVSSADLPRSCR